MYQTFKGMVAENAPAVAKAVDVLANCAVNAMRSLAPKAGAVLPDNRVPYPLTDLDRSRAVVPAVTVAPVEVLIRTPTFVAKAAPVPPLNNRV